MNAVKLQLKDLDFFLSTVLVHGKGNKDRYIPFGSFAHDSMEKYIKNGRKILMENHDSHDFFLLTIEEGHLPQEEYVWF